MRRPWVERPKTSRGACRASSHSTTRSRRCLDGSERRRWSRKFLTDLFADIGLVSTPSDLARFGNALLQGSLLERETMEMMFTPRTTSDGEINAQYYGLGWRMGGMYYPSGSDTIITMINHGGTSVGGTAILLLFPDSGLVIAMTANVTPPGGSGPLRSEAASIARIFLDHMSAE